MNVPYNGSGQAILGVVGGDVHMMIDGITSSLPQVMSNKLRALGVGTKGRLKEVPGVPAIAEKFPGYVGSTWLGLFAPAARRRRSSTGFTGRSLPSCGNPNYAIG